jgi:predicted GIY-YIG superfamily endonuclease
MTDVHALYRFFAVTDELLYIGIAADPGRRLTQHSVVKVWWHEVARVTIEPHLDRPAVLAAERLAISLEHPKYNVIHNKLVAAGQQRPSRAVKSPAAVKSRARRHDRFTGLKLQAMCSLYEPDEGIDGYVTCTVIRMLPNGDVRVTRDDTGREFTIQTDNGRIDHTRYVNLSADWYNFT